MNSLNYLYYYYLYTFLLQNFRLKNIYIELITVTWLGAIQCQRNKIETVIYTALKIRRISQTTI